MLDVQSPHKKGFQSTPSARRATSPPFCFRMFHVISIHALREESDHKSVL